MTGSSTTTTLKRALEMTSLMSGEEKPFSQQVTFQVKDINWRSALQNLYVCETAQTYKGTSSSMAKQRLSTQPRRSLVSTNSAVKRG